MDFLKITKSKTREKILRLFFSDIDKKYYLRELERLLGLPVGNVRRELLSLEKTGLFLKEEMGNQTYYFLNKKSVIFPDFKNIVLKTIGVAGALKRELADLAGIECSFIFGSFARNAEDSFSDVDLMIIGTPNEDHLIEKISLLESEIRREINYSIFSLQDFQKGLKKKEVFLQDLVEKPKIFVIGNQNDLEKIIGRRKPSNKKD